MNLENLKNLFGLYTAPSSRYLDTLYSFLNAVNDEYKAMSSGRASKSVLGGYNFSDTEKEDINKFLESISSVGDELSIDSPNKNLLWDYISGELDKNAMILSTFLRSTVSSISPEDTYGGFDHRYHKVVLIILFSCFNIVRKENKFLAGQQLNCYRINKVEINEDDSFFIKAKIIYDLIHSIQSNIKVQDENIIKATKEIFEKMVDSMSVEGSSLNKDNGIKYIEEILKVTSSDKSVLGKIESIANKMHCYVEKPDDIERDDINNDAVMLQKDYVLVILKALLEKVHTSEENSSSKKELQEKIVNHLKKIKYELIKHLFSSDAVKSGYLKKEDYISPIISGILEKSVTDYQLLENPYENPKGISFFEERPGNGFWTWISEDPNDQIQLATQDQIDGSNVIARAVTINAAKNSIEHNINNLKKNGVKKEDLIFLIDSLDSTLRDIKNLFSSDYESESDFSFDSDSDEDQEGKNKTFSRLNHSCKEYIKSDGSVDSSKVIPGKLKGVPQNIKLRLLLSLFLIAASFFCSSYMVGYFIAFSGWNLMKFAIGYCAHRQKINEKVEGTSSFCNDYPQLTQDASGSTLLGGIVKKFSQRISFAIKTCLWWKDFSFWIFKSIIVREDAKVYNKISSKYMLYDICYLVCGSQLLFSLGLVSFTGFFTTFLTGSFLAGAQRIMGSLSKAAKTRFKLNILEKDSSEKNTLNSRDMDVHTWGKNCVSSYTATNLFGREESKNSDGEENTLLP